VNLVDPCRWVAAVASEYLLVAISATITGRVFVLDSNPDPSKLANFKASFDIGQPVLCHLLKVIADSIPPPPPHTPSIFQITTGERNRNRS